VYEQLTNLIMTVEIYNVQSSFSLEDTCLFASSFDFSECDKQTFEMSLKHHDYIDTIQNVDIYKCLITGVYLFIEPKND
jgi:hypothetical protein